MHNVGLKVESGYEGGVILTFAQHHYDIFKALSFLRVDYISLSGLLLPHVCGMALRFHSICNWCHALMHCGRAKSSIENASGFLMQRKAAWEFISFGKIMHEAMGTM
jgi:hypothetical protein